MSLSASISDEDLGSRTGGRRLLTTRRILQELALLEAYRIPVGIDVENSAVIPADLRQPDSVRRKTLL